MTNFGVAVAIFQDEQILLTQREDFEVYEETGLEVRLTRLVGIYSKPAWYGGQHIILFAAEVTGGEMRPQPGEVIDIRYFPITALPDALLLGSRHRVLDAAGGLGGSVAVCEDFPWIFGNLKNRQEIYAARDQHPDTPSFTPSLSRALTSLKFGWKSGSRGAACCAPH